MKYIVSNHEDASTALYKTEEITAISDRVDMVVMCGQARSHCHQFSLNNIVESIRSKKPTLLVDGIAEWDEQDKVIMNSMPCSCIYSDDAKPGEE